MLLNPLAIGVAPSVAQDIGLHIDAFAPCSEFPTPVASSKNNLRDGLVYESVLIGRGRGADHQQDSIVAKKTSAVAQFPLELQDLGSGCQKVAENDHIETMRTNIARRFVVAILALIPGRHLFIEFNRAEITKGPMVVRNVPIPPRWSIKIGVFGEVMQPTPELATPLHVVDPKTWTLSVCS